MCACVCDSICVCVYIWVTHRSKEAAIIILPLAGSKVDKEKVSLCSKEATAVVVEGVRCVEKWEAPLEVVCPERLYM